MSKLDTKIKCLSVYGCIIWNELNLKFRYYSIFKRG